MRQLFYHDAVLFPNTANFLSLQNDAVIVAGLVGRNTLYAKIIP
jgi:hypothetical protein